jgi:hypothetical protein
VQHGAAYGYTDGYTRGCAMSDLQTRAQQLYDAGRRTAYAIGYATVDDPAIATHLNICLGEQWSGRRLYLVDLDSHTAEQDADAARSAFRAARPELDAQLDWYRSKSGTGWHALFESSVQISTGKLYDHAGRHIGELLGADGHRAIDPGDIQIPILHIGEVERLLNVWHVQTSSPKGEHWADRAKQGAQWTRGAQHIPVTKKQLRTFLQNDAGPVGKDLDRLFDQHKPFNRSDAAGTLMQNLMFFARRLPGCANAPFHTVCANVKAYWMAADSFGKAGEKGYCQDKDGDSLIAQIVNQDPYGPADNPRYWKCPSWVPGNIATTAPAPAPEKAAPRPAHRPAGDRAKHLVTFRRVLAAIEPDDFGRRTYTLAYLVDRMKAARCTVAPRTIQSYLKTLRGDPEKNDGEIVTAQIGGNGIPYAVLKPCFEGADNSQKRVESDPKPDMIGDANACAAQAIATPESAESTHNAKEDHQNPSAPTAEPGGASYSLGRDWTAGGRLDSSGWRDPREMRVPAEPVDRTPPPRHVRRQKRQKGQGSFLGRDQDIAATFKRKKHHGEAPVPTPYRQRTQLVLETLLEPPAVAAPAGAQGAGAPLSAPAGAAPAHRMAERQRRLKAQETPL